MPSRAPLKSTRTPSKPSRAKKKTLSFWTSFGRSCSSEGWTEERLPFNCESCRRRHWCRLQCLFLLLWQRACIATKSRMFIPSQLWKPGLGQERRENAACLREPSIACISLGPDYISNPREELGAKFHPLCTFRSNKRRWKKRNPRTKEIFA